jgi:predicted lysophospholipase L1 biosynthesis ABC-type transport system permease subunit
MPGNPLTDPNWATDVTDLIERGVSQLRNRTTRPIVMAARGIVFGLLAGITGIVALTLFTVALFRGLQAILEVPFDHETAVWVSYVLVGVLLVIAGMVAMAKRHTEELLDELA